MDVSVPSGEPPGRILLIDGDPAGHQRIRGLLERRGFEVERHGEAAAGVEAARRRPPDVILLDLDLPDLDGIDACRCLRRDPELSNVAVMLVSAGAKDRFIEAGFQAGANDYLEKPFTETELLARVDNLTRMTRNGAALRAAAAELRRNNETLSREMQAARRVQWALLPSVLSPHPSLRAAVFFEPMVEVGGDLYDVTLAPDGMVRILVADVSGHGVFAALLAAFFKMGYQVYASRERGPSAVLQAIHGELCQSLESADFVTAVSAWLDPATGRLRYASAGHVPALVRRARDAATESIEATGPVIGIVDGSRFGEGEILLEPGDGLLFLTDGILEALGPGGDAYGIGRVERLLARHPRTGPAEILQNLRIDLENFQGQIDPDDDMTALALAWDPRPLAAEDRLLSASAAMIAGSPPRRP